MTQFNDLGLAAPILKALAQEGYATPTPIQAQAIPILMGGRDLIGLAQTGTGKTAAFALPLLHRLAQARKHPGATGCRVLVLAPTRELAAQIGDAFRAYGRFLGLSTAVVFGGAPMGKQVHAMARGVDVLVATPGRLIDHIEQRSVTLKSVEALVLDEADHMLDIGFIHALKRIATILPKQRQSVFFSATMPAPIQELAGQFLTDPEHIAVTPVSSTAEKVEQRVIHVGHERKADILADLLQDDAISRALVFTRTKHGADKVKRKLEEAGEAVEAIHGNKSQGQRERALENFRRGRARLLVATEIAARGIDVDDVSHVINFDLPNVPEQYVHRIGRTARAGQTGMAISFCAPDERVFLRDIERLTRLPVTVQEHPLALPTPSPEDKLPPPLKMGGGRQQQGRGKPGGRQTGPNPHRGNHPASKAKRPPKVYDSAFADDRKPARAQPDRQAGGHAGAGKPHANDRSSAGERQSLSDRPNGAKPTRPKSGAPFKRKGDDMWSNHASAHRGGARPQGQGRRQKRSGG